MIGRSHRCTNIASGNTTGIMFTVNTKALYQIESKHTPLMHRLFEEKQRPIVHIAKCME